MSEEVLSLAVEGVSKSFALPRKHPFAPKLRVSAVADVNLNVRAGETVAIVGESGCGKSTLGRLVTGLSEPDTGHVKIGGVDRALTASSGKRDHLREVQLVFQDPLASLSPRRTVAQTLMEPLRNFDLCGSDVGRRRRVSELLEKVRIPASAGSRFPHEFSGGQRQRIAIARALATSPSLIVCDEAVAALDVSVKAQIINLLMDLQEAESISLLFISHDLPIVQHLADSVSVMYLGRIVESGSRDDVFLDPKHPYTQALLAASPMLQVGRRARATLTGEIPSPTDVPRGCAFSGRCPAAVSRCFVERPQLSRLGETHREVACHLVG
ncbi:ABC transporter ATP-binding protein [Aminobacter aminovorans]|uniref:Oligopeptide/dipeptide ABC transporter ATP-binding protein n=1 Tax=Aminobacter aminovorans TaxID=83263 RepID=A0AAC9ATQ1_AMIAI|nr:oligopeptide/dipeptide ABC transporter ATP-binding protein [Aminobacter aminovorans]AMS45451.1 Peptide ABC transporter substrate-binding protein [Aminobacter aminovorans]MBB3708658.1 oligopeptide/dipeptide ABC transporter ATP-binding protein [Aminobacter aminovorans]